MKWMDDDGMSLIATDVVSDSCRAVFVLTPVSCAIPTRPRRRAAEKLPRTHTAARENRLVGLFRVVCRGVLVRVSAPAPHRRGRFCGQIRR